MEKDKVFGGLFGVCIGDALGVPVEFIERYELKENPIVDMVGYGQYNQPRGTWSDDSSLTFCLAESLLNGFDIQDIADKFCRWMQEGYWSPHGEVFDIGDATRNAIIRLQQGISPIDAGGKTEYNNGNGSLMRILPLAYFLKKLDIDKQFTTIHQVSCLTHGHFRSQMACGIYIQFAINLLNDNDLNPAYKKTKRVCNQYYSIEPYKSELHHFKRILELDISQLREDSIKSSSYVIDTLEASLWCLLNNKSYSDTVLTAVNLGEDTDTTGAVAGGLAGIYYSYKNIPQKWRDSVARVEDIADLCERFYLSIK